MPNLWNDLHRPRWELLMHKLIITNQIQIPFINDEFDDFIYSNLTMLNPKWLENQRLGRFNRNTPKELRFYEETGSKKTGVNLYAPRGFLKDILQYCETNKIKITIENRTHVYEDINWEFSGELRPFQKVAIRNILKEDQGVLCAPTGSGKTVMAIYVISNHRQPTIIIVHTKELLYQWADRLKAFLNINDNQIGFVGDGILQDDRDITIALIQTLNKYPEIVNNHGFLIVDECHRCPSRTFTEAIKEFQGKYILGLSATPFRRDGLTKVINWYAGPILHTIGPQELIQTGHITSIEAIIRRTNFITLLENPSTEYSTLLLEISQDKERNLMIAKDVAAAVSMGETCLVLTDRKAHCDELKRLISPVPAEILTGDTLDKPRKKIVENVNKGKIKVLICTGQLIGEGFDCKNLSAIFLTMPISYHGRIIQYLGRVLRPAKGKERALVYDYFDQSVKCLYSGYKSRQKEYKKLGG